MPIPETTITHLKDLISKQIETQEGQVEGQKKTNNLYRKILKRLAWITIIVLLLLLTGTYSLVYTINRPHSILRVLEDKLSDNGAILTQSKAEVVTLKAKVDTLEASIRKLRSEAKKQN